MEFADKESTSPDEKDAYLLDKIANKRDRLAMDQFYQAYRIRLRAFLYRLLHNRALVEEIYNEVMLIIWQKASQFNGRSKVSTWVLSIAYRHGLQGLRKENKHLSVEQPIEQSVVTSEIAGEEQQIIRKALTQLSFEHRTVIELAYFVGNNYAEIAEITNCSESTVKTRMFYARRRLLKELAKIGITSVM